MCRLIVSRRSDEHLIPEVLFSLCTGKLIGIPIYRQINRMTEIRTECCCGKAPSCFTGCTPRVTDAAQESIWRGRDGRVVPTAFACLLSNTGYSSLARLLDCCLPCSHSYTSSNLFCLFFRIRRLLMCLFVGLCSFSTSPPAPPQPPPSPPHHPPTIPPPC